MRFNEELNENEKLMLTEVKKIVSLRKNHSALSYGDFYTLIADDNIYSFVRSDFNERILVVLNKNEQADTVSLKFPDSINSKSIKDLISGEEINLINGNLSVNVDGIGWRMFIVK